MRPTSCLTCAAVLAALAVTGCGSSSSHPAHTMASGSTGASGSTTAAGSTTASVPANPANGRTPGPEGVPLEAGPFLAPSSTASQGATVDGIRCQANEQAAYHIHAHLQVYLDGLPRAIPGGIGIAGAVAQQSAAGPFYQATRCYYWLHTHASDGVIHVESPTQQIYTLGDFFDEWRQPLSAHRVASLRGRVTATVNGRPWRRSPRDIPLVPHAAIQLAVGQPTPPYHPVSWAGTGL